MRSLSAILAFLALVLLPGCALTDSRATAAQYTLQRTIDAEKELQAAALSVNELVSNVVSAGKDAAELAEVVRQDPARITNPGEVILGSIQTALEPAGRVADSLGNIHEQLSESAETMSIMTDDLGPPPSGTDLSIESGPMIRAKYQAAVAIFNKLKTFGKKLFSIAMPGMSQRLGVAPKPDDGWGFGSVGAGLTALLALWGSTKGVKGIVGLAGKAREGFGVATDLHSAVNKLKALVDPQQFQNIMKDHQTAVAFHKQVTAEEAKKVAG